MAPNDLRADRPLVGDRAPPSPTPQAAPPGRPPRPPRKGRADSGGGGRGIGRWIVRLTGLGMGVVVAGGVVAALGAYGVYREAAGDLPEHAWLADYQPPQMSRIYAADSRLMAELATERRVFLPIGAIPPRLQAAFVSAEDQNFWTHPGVDFLALSRATVQNVEGLMSGRRALGASTITQQVAKNMLVGNDRTILRKVREAILAFRLESAMPKERILEIYLNEIFLGQQAYGVAAAAMNYFNKGLDELTLGETAFLGALPKAPNNYNPLRYPEAAKARRDWVLDRMAEDGAVSRAEADAAKQEPIVPRGRIRPELLATGQYFTEEVRRELVARFGQDQTNMGGLVVRTSLEPELQQATERALQAGLTSYDRRRGGWRGPVASISADTTEWMPALEKVARPAGALPEWRLAVALSVQAGEARLAWLDRPEGRAQAQPRQGTLALADVSGWARPVNAQGRLGAPPRRLQDVLKPGDVVLVEPREAGGRGAAANAAGNGPVRVSLRQVPLVEGAIVALDPATGRVLSMAGGWSFDRSWFNRATQALRQPGSSFKPFVYLPALEMGIPPNQRLLDGPIEIMTPQGLWKPSNYSGNPRGWVTMRTAIQQSLNLVTIRLAQEVGIERVAETAARFHVIPNMPRVLSMALGAGETTVMRMAAAYASFVNGGKEVSPTLIDTVQDRFGKMVWRADNRHCARCDAGPNAPPPQLVDERKQITDPIAAYQMVSMLQGVVQYGSGKKAGEGLNRPVAGKTGTTNDYMDNWFVGFTPDIVVAVWLGFDEPRSLGSGEAGGVNAAPIFHDVVEAALKNSPPVPFRAPPGVALVRTQIEGGASILEAFRPGTENAARPPIGEGLMSSDTPAGTDSSLGGLY
ncbi:penicillin-binding protein 1A [Teichococcus vastitatis]|uniref:penicillin-binding protein 1A n=1 Tax=Teichococcus vastitatis TaxID=2307076 RepID=UPI00192E4A6C|nr:PBP1A family penicillin-binding protein [Pseudoroseomonas vastitatis]